MVFAQRYTKLVTIHLLHRLSAVYPLRRALAVGVAVLRHAGTSLLIPLSISPNRKSPNNEKPPGPVGVDSELISRSSTA